MDERSVVLLGEVLVQLPLRDPRKVIVVGAFGQVGGHGGEAAVVVRAEEVSPYAEHAVVGPVFFLVFSERPDCVVDGLVVLELYFEEVV